MAGSTSHGLSLFQNRERWFSLLILSCRRITKSYGEIDVLKGVDLDITIGERIGIIGMNGSGKSTLMEIIAGALAPDEGELAWWQTGVRIGYLRQSAADPSSAGGEWNHSLTESIHSEIIVESACPGDPSECERFLETVRRLGVAEVHCRTARSPEDLSGGERTKLALARVWAGQPDLLLLDEPTNHLDLLGVEWLVRQLTAYRGTVAIISHDRYLLDQVTTRTVEIEDGMAKTYSGNYSFYREEKARIRTTQLREYEEAKRERMRIEEEIRRVRQWSAKAHRDAGKKADVRMGVKEFDRSKAKRMDRQVKSRIRRLERLKREGPAKPRDEESVRFSLQNAAICGRRIAMAKEISKSYDGKTLFRDSSFCILRGDKVGLYGPNGCGKTTLFRILIGDELADRGEIWLSPSARIGYLSQVHSWPDQAHSVVEALAVSDRTVQTKARWVLAQMGIGEDLVNKPIKSLSSGERTKVELARLVLSEADLLLLDEPTNHLDIQSREQLEEALKNYDGTVVIASHDRYLLEAVCDRLLEFDGERIRERWSMSEG
jgi:macrolide transport system ATP-binding/permease protein